MSEKDLQFEISAEVAEGDYSNLAVVHNSVSEFVLDFAKVLPGSEQALVTSRIILSPMHAKRLLMALNGNIKSYEQEHGVIEENPTPISQIKPQGKA